MALTAPVAWVGPRDLNFSFDFIDPYDGSTKLGHWVEATLAADGASLAFVNGSDWGTTEDMIGARASRVAHASRVAPLRGEPGGVRR